MFLTRSTITSSRVVDWPTPDGARTYPLVVVEVTAGSHPFGPAEVGSSIPQARSKNSTAATASGLSDGLKVADDGAS
jgi:hypothetical protein